MGDEITRREFEQLLREKARNSQSFKRELLTNPKVVVERVLGIKAPDWLEIVVLEETISTKYLLVPSKIEIAGLSNEDLDILAGGDYDIGAAGYYFKKRPAVEEV